MTEPQKTGHTAGPWENGAKIKIIFPDTISGGEWWRIFNSNNEMTVLALYTKEARQIVDSVNGYTAMKAALEEIKQRLSGPFNSCLYDILQIVDAALTASRLHSERDE